MQIPLEWINELVNVESINLNDLIEKLTLGGFEVEDVIETKIDNKKYIALDISATANRSDSLSVQGIGLEIATLLAKTNKISNYSLQNFIWKNQLTDSFVEVANNPHCSSFITVIIENLNEIKVPKWIKQKLISSGLTPTNNLLDFQNYILLETGYPFAFYDFNKICSALNSDNFKLSVTEAEQNYSFCASNGLTYQLNNSNLILCANNLPIGIAGIIEHNDYAYTEKLNNSLLIEASIFNPAVIRQQSRNLGLRTDRSARYEKSLKDIYLIESLYRLISLLRISNPDLICKLNTVCQANKKILTPITLHYQTISEILGPIQTTIGKGDIYISPETIISYLKRLNFKFSYDASKLIWNVEIPDARTDDIKREIDLIEEIGRLHGFNNFVTSLPKIAAIGHEDSSYQTRKKITSCLLSLGFNELIHYSLVNAKTFLTNETKLVNPLLSDCSHLRSSLLPGLIKTVQENLKQGNLSIEGFEFGHIFSGDWEISFQEREAIAGIFGGIKKKLTWSDSETPLNWFEAKGKIEQLFRQLNLTISWKNSNLNDIDYNEIIHPYRSARLYLTNGEKVGVFGQINPILANRLSISPQLYLFEFDLKVLINQIQINKLSISKDYSLYPKIIKDLSFIIDENIEFKEIQEFLYSNGTKFLSEINLLDEYKAKPIPDGYRSLCIQLTFQSKEKTLENKEIETIVNSLQLILTDKFNALIRD